ncbi:MAG: trehalose-phosphatase [Alphaproteobacteria bacterium]|nr:trehalose-phosphatase [Alphaproteobacteria bacterium]
MALVPPVGETAFLLDIDGTLLDLMPTPGEVFVPPGLAETLRRLLELSSGALALVSGRRLHDIDRIFAPDRFAAVGGHGVELRRQANAAEVISRVPALDRELAGRLKGLAELDPGIVLEDKVYSLALHYRLAPHRGEEIALRIAQICVDLTDLPIDVLPGKFVYEIKPAGFTKAGGVRELMALEPFRGRRPLFIGDDVTDESVFAIMPEMNGLAFSVGREAEGVNGCFGGPQDVREFLARLAR